MVHTPEKFGKTGGRLRIVVFGDGVIPPSMIREQILNKAGGFKDLEILEYEMPLDEPRELPGVSEAWGDPQQLVDNIRGTDVLIVHMAPVTREVIDAGTDLKLIGCCRGSPVNVDVPYATVKKIPVVYAPGRNAHAVADLTIGLMIAEARGIAKAHALIKSGIWSPPSPGIELWGKTLGIIGLGNVGSLVAFRARNGFNMRVLAYDPYVPREKAEKLGVELVDLETLLQESDFVTIHSRAPSGSKPQITSEHIALMKPTAYLINTSRGYILDEKALYEALKEEKIAGAALDVYEKEPIEPDNPLLKLDNITLTSHIGGITREIPLRTAEIIAEDIARFIRGEKPVNVQNPEVFE